jgi:serine/threonine-protein kinase
MNPERWEIAKQVFETALELDPAQHAAYLDRACAGDAEVRREVEAMLLADGQADPFIDTPVFTTFQDLLAGDESELPLPAAIGRYTIHSRLGAGGMGEVYLAEEATLGRRVALKVLAPHAIAQSGTVERFMREARLASALDHPNICTIFDAGVADGTPFISMQYVEGDTLQRLIHDRRLPVERWLPIALQVAEALRAAHAGGIVHRDLKSSNIMVTPGGQVKVLDFGVAKMFGQAGASGVDAGLTRPGVTVGTPSYLSPEQARGGAVDQRSDIFSFGIVLHEMATGRLPFIRPSAAEVMHAIINEPHPPVGQCNIDVPPTLAAAIDRALAKDPGERFQSLDDMIRELRGSSGEERVAIPPPRTRRARRTAAVVLAAGVVLAGLAMWPVFERTPPSPPPGGVVRSIAVLPFKPLVAGDRNESLELGMADTLIFRLSSVKGIAVRPISAVRKYADLRQDPLAAGRELGVDAVLDSSIQVVGEKIRVTTRLLRVEDGSVLWTEKTNEQLADVFAAQDAIAEKLVGSLALTLTDDERKRLTRRYTDNTEAYQLYLKGRYFWNKRTADSLQKGIAYFKQAIEKDPGYALAYAGLADSYAVLQITPGAPAEGALPAARAAAERALALDDSLAEAHTSLGRFRMASGDWSGADAAFRRAIELNPRLETAHQWYAMNLAIKGRLAEAEAEIRLALELDPLSLIINTDAGRIFFYMRAYDRAIAQFTKTLEMDPAFGRVRVMLGAAYEQKGLYKEALDQYQQTIPASRARIARVYARSGRGSEARKFLDEVKAAIPAALIHAALGENQLAIDDLERAYEEDPASLSFAGVDPTWDSLRSEPRFHNLLRRAGLPSRAPEPAGQRGR